jgi:hypothetical protein
MYRLDIEIFVICGGSLAFVAIRTLLGSLQAGGILVAFSGT